MSTIKPLITRPVQIMAVEPEAGTVVGSINRPSSEIERGAAPIRPRRSSHGNLGRTLRFHDLLQVRQACLEIVADHLIHVDEQPHGLGAEVALAIKRPSDGGLVALRLKNELRRVRAGEWAHELQLDLDQLAWPTLHNRRASLAD